MEDEKNLNDKTTKKEVKKTTAPKSVSKKNTTQKATTTKKTNSKNKSNTIKSNTNKSKGKSTKTRNKSTTPKVATVKNVESKEKSTTEKLDNKTTKSQSKTASNKTDTTKKANSKEEILEQENLIAQVENVTEQAEVYEELQKDDLHDSNNDLIDPKTLKMDQLEDIKKEIKNNKKSNSSKNKKKLKYNEIFENTIIFIFIQIYFMIIIIGTFEISAIRYITDLKVIILLEAIISIIIFEVAYAKDNTKLAVHGIEMLGIGIATVVILDLYSRQSFYLDFALAGMVEISLVYYLIKVLFISLRKKPVKK